MSRTETGFRGTFVISWNQTELPGLPDAGPDDLHTGMLWRWRGEAMRLDGPPGLLLLGARKGRGKAPRPARGGPSWARDKEDRAAEAAEDPFGPGVVLTDGHKRYTATLIETARDTAPDTAPGGAAGRKPLLMFLDRLPPRGRDLWIVSIRSAGREGKAPACARATGQGVICFTPGTLLRTPEGARPVEALREGDLVLTRDDGPQEIIWRASRRMSGARLFARPALRPVRIRAGALGEEAPEGDLLVSPSHRLLIRGTAARRLFNEPEVLARAGDLVNDHSILIDHRLREVRYVHLMFERHQVLWANGIESESFNPAEADMDTISPDDRARLLSAIPALGESPAAYGAPARRCIGPLEAEILKEDGALSAAGRWRRC